MDDTTFEGRELEIRSHQASSVVEIFGERTTKDW